jgi:hypothetical protein
MENSEKTHFFGSMNAMNPDQWNGRIQAVSGRAEEGRNKN